MPLLLSGTEFPRSVLLLESLLTVAMASGLRFGVRALAQAARTATPEEKRRLVLVGGGDTGEAMLRSIHRTMPGVEPVGILDDDPRKQGMRIHGVPVLGGVDDAPRILAAGEGHRGRDRHPLRHRSADAAHREPRSPAKG